MDQKEVDVQAAITKMRQHMLQLERHLWLGEGIWRDEAEKTIELAQDVRNAIAAYMGEE